MENKKYQINEDTINQIIEWAHSYGRSMQFNYGLFGADCEHAKPFTVEKATQYINEKIVNNLNEL